MCANTVSLGHRAPDGPLLEAAGRRGTAPGRCHDDPSSPGHSAMHLTAPHHARLAVMASQEECQRPPTPRPVRTPAATTVPPVGGIPAAPPRLLPPSWPPAGQRGPSAGTARGPRSLREGVFKLDREQNCKGMPWPNTRQLPERGGQGGAVMGDVPRCEP